jgi:hypothetical protein
MAIKKLVLIGAVLGFAATTHLANAQSYTVSPNIFTGGSTLYSDSGSRQPILDITPTPFGSSGSYTIKYR